MSSAREKKRAGAALGMARAIRRAQLHPDDPELVAKAEHATRDYYASQLGEHIKAIVDKAPPFTSEQRENLAVLLRGAPDE